MVDRPGRSETCALFVSQVGLEWLPAPGLQQLCPDQADMQAQVVQLVGVGQRYADLAHVGLDRIQPLQQLL